MSRKIRQRTRRLVLKALRMARADAGLTISELAKRAGVSRDTISNAERGQHSLQAATLHKVAQALGRAPSELLAEEERLTPKAPSSSLEPSLFNGLEDERRASLRSWIDFAGRLAGRWAGEIEDREGRSSTASSAAKKHVMMLPNLHWAVEIMSTYTDVVEAVATDPNYDAWVYGREEVHELYAATRRMREAVDRTKDWFPSGQEDPKMAEVIDLRRAAIERAEKRLGARAS